MLDYLFDVLDDFPAWIQIPIVTGLITLFSFSVALLIVGGAFWLTSLATQK